MNAFAEYVAHGWKLCAIEPGLKGPTEKGWNAVERMVTHPLAASKLEAAGLCHAYSGTCAIDIDNVTEAQAWLRERGIDLVGLMSAADAVRIRSPRFNAGKLIYRLPVPLPSKKINDEHGKAILELRCAAANGLTVQDVLPPSPYPGGGNYEWIGDWESLPELPGSLFTLWQSLVTAPTEGSAEPTVTRDQLIASLKRLSPDAGYDDWLKIGMAIHHEFNGSDEGLALWDAWSKRSAKYKGIQDLAPHWKSFSAGGGVTGQSLEVMVPWSIDDFPSEARNAEINAHAAVQAQQQLSAVKLWTAAEALQPHDSPPFLVDRLLEQGAEASLIGPSKSYKSLFALQMSVCIATGTPFFGRETEQGLVVYLCGEGFGGIRHRLQALRHGMGLDFSDAPFVVLPRPLALPTEEGVQTVRQYIAAAEQKFGRKLALLVIDTYGRYAAGEENVAEDLYKFFRAASLCRNGGALLVVHHTGHSDATRGRGTSAWEQAVDTEFVASIKADTETRVFENTKQKDGEPAAPMFFRLARQRTDSTRVGEPVWSVVLEPAIVEATAPRLGANEQMIFDHVTEAPGLPQEALIAAVVEKTPKPDGRDKRREYARRALLGLISKKLVVLKHDRVFRADDVTADFADLIGAVQ